jgi:HEAT repeat protein
MKKTAAWAIALAVAVTQFVGAASAFEYVFDYAATPMVQALTAHELVIVGTVKEHAKGEVTVVPVATIKGMPPGEPLILPDVWRPGTEFSFGPIPLEAGKTYFLMLHRQRDRAVSLSPDHAAEAVVAVESPDAPLVRAATVLCLLAEQSDADARKMVLANMWGPESDETKLLLLTAFAQSPADAATVPALVDAMNAGAERSSLMEMSATIIQRHQYRETIPDLLKALEKHDWACIYPARTLGVLKARDAYEPIMALINDPQAQNRPYFIEALALLEDKRSLPFLLKTLEHDLPGIDPAYGTYRTRNVQENEFAAMGLGRLRAVEAVRPLIKVLGLDSAYKNLKTLAVTSLGQIGPPAESAVPKIRELLSRGEVPKEVAEVALFQIKRVPPSGPSDEDPSDPFESAEPPGSEGDTPKEG